MPARNSHRHRLSVNKVFSCNIDSSSNHSTKSVIRSICKEEKQGKTVGRYSVDDDNRHKFRRTKQTSGDDRLETNDRNNKPRQILSKLGNTIFYEKVVQFRSTVHVRRIKSHRRFCQEERNAIWYSSSEIEKHRASMKSIVKRLSLSTPATNLANEIDDDDYRGLEHKLHTKKNKARLRRKTAILRSVLEEQEKIYRHRLEKRCSHALALAEVYTSCNWQCVVEARKRGVEDFLASDAVI